MKRRLAIVIAVETYADSRVTTDDNYAEADLKGFAKALENGCPIDKGFLLCGLRQIILHRILHCPVNLIKLLLHSDR